MKFEKYKEQINLKHEPFIEEMEQLHLLYYPKKDMISVEQQDSIKEIIENTKIIKKLLKPLEEMGLDFSISIVGGAVRDFVLNKASLINDHDFVVSLNKCDTFIPQLEPENIHHFFNDLEMTEIKKVLKANTPPSSLIRHHDSYNTFVWPRLFEKIMKFSNNDYKLFNLANIQEVKDKHENYLIINEAIHSLYKIKNINKKDMDIIVSKYNHNGSQYTRTFDFEICKGAVDLNFINDTSENEIVDMFIDNMCLLPGMLRDIHNKTLSIQAARFELAHVQYFLNKHYPKLKAKYPEYQINTIFAPHCSNKDSESFVLAHQLDNDCSDLIKFDKKRLKI
jgi:hypothetical protein